MIDDVDRTLMALLRSELTGVDAERIAVVSPEDASGHDVHLGLFLYAAIENPMLKNEPPRALTAGRVERPLTLDLYYLLTAYGSGTEATPSGRSLSGHRLLARALRAFYDHGTLPGRFRQGAVADQDDLRVSLNPITVEDMTRIWSVFPNQAYRPSAGYLVTPVRVTREFLEEGARVVDHETHHGAARAPLVGEPQ